MDDKQTENKLAKFGRALLREILMGVVQTLLLAIVAFFGWAAITDIPTAWGYVMENFVPFLVLAIVLLIIVIVANVHFRLSQKYGETKKKIYMAGFVVISICFVYTAMRTVGRDWYLPAYFPTPTHTIAPTSTPNIIKETVTVPITVVVTATPSTPTPTLTTLEMWVPIIRGFLNHLEADETNQAINEYGSTTYRMKFETAEEQNRENFFLDWRYRDTILINRYYNERIFSAPYYIYAQAEIIEARPGRDPDSQLFELVFWFSYNEAMEKWEIDDFSATPSEE